MRLIELEGKFYEILVCANIWKFGWLVRWVKGLKHDGVTQKNVSL